MKKIIFKELIEHYIKGKNTKSSISFVLITPMLRL